MTMMRESTGVADHPLTPLSQDEVSRAADILRTEQELGENMRFAGIQLHEPPKDQVLANRSEERFAREAFVVLFDRAEGSTYEAVVSLSDGTVISYEHVPDVHPGIVLDEFDEAEEACKADPEFREAIRKRGLTDMDLVCVEPWSAGYYGEDYEGKRLIRALVYTRLAEGDNPYAHPVDNLIPVIDLNKMAVDHIEDDGPVPVPRKMGNYSPEAVGGTRSDLKPIEITQPEGTSFTVDGHEIYWQKWRLRIGFTPREGLVLYTVGYEDGGEERPVLYRASLSEMVVPYGDPSPIQSKKNAFDAGEYNIGALANSLELGCDCLGEITYFDAVLSDSMGNPQTINNAVCLHEEDAGTLWKHTDMRTEDVEVRRSRRLVISFVATVANYEYGFFWYLYQDGAIEFDVKLTGIVSTAYHDPSEKPEYGQLLNDEGLYAPIHQHLFNVRLDLDVDGQENSVYEVHTERAPRGENNPQGNAFFARSSLLANESGAKQPFDPMSSRYWKVLNHSRKNAVGEPVGYKLVPMSNVLPFTDPGAHVMQRAGFTQNHLWVTPYEPTERYAAGDYPNQSTGGNGLPAYTASNRSVEDTDVVLWYTLGAHHTPRLEDWPVMPVQHAGFKLEPVGFFDQSPAIDVPRPGGNGHCHHSD